MKALSIQQPWAQYIAAGIKDIENRSWALKTFPQRVLIHTGKKKQFESTDNLPMLYQLIIENAENIGIVPLIDDMPTGAIIGVVDIVDCNVEDDSSVWSNFSDDPAHPIYNLKLVNAKLFKEPILNVKGKQGIFDVPEIDEEHLPETVDVPCISRKGNELFIPLDEEEVEEYANMDEDGFTFDYNLLDDNLDLFATFNSDEELEPIPTDYVTVFNGDKKARVKVEKAEIEFIPDEDGNDTIYYNPAGDELTWVKVFYHLVPENSKKKSGKKRSADVKIADALKKLDPHSQNIIAAIESVGYPYEYHKEPGKDYATVSTQLEDGQNRLDAFFVVNLEYGVVTLSVGSERKVPMKMVKKAIERASDFTSFNPSIWLMVDPHNGAVCARLSNVYHNSGTVSHVTVEAAGQMLAHAGQIIDTLFRELIK
jgi:hypothetical protein